eukprot:Gregarina_sp_Poly_1__10698@NODE_80_length_15637_cov_125_963134_g68_i0_p16_GENE_NODE_80_length_15637_cov_125_963134_g68_i0NODE_80_length_15637_cov_125_963134_g68_i0_p16_ORF_typecomplete_len106_score3_98Methyltransf_10/PF05971_12/1_9e24MTS/PF05175_14/2_1e09UPF0020/PF01170_18/1_4e05PrmA/PF06325_13/0_00031Methyltransf_31/PF13847_6/0_00042Methyltransf_25/PF13649_6/0_0041Methyltransf_23/PF13489_6/0_0064Methyltransf_15/PF09445_10/0_048TehB/PF03848_14/0_053Methyltransf_11/PF08241_12/0_079N6_Mtase/PF0238
MCRLFCRYQPYIDRGVGANCIHPLLIVKEFGWSVIGTDIDATALKIAQETVTRNQLEGKISLCQQADPGCFFLNIPYPCGGIHLTICNPPFYRKDNVKAHPSRVT